MTAKTTGRSGQTARKTSTGNRKGSNGKKTGNHTGTAKRNATSKKKTPGKEKEILRAQEEARLQEAEQKFRFQNEAIILGVLVFCVLLLLSAFGLCGIVGRGISYVLFGLFGLMGYLFPVLFFIGTAFLVCNRKNRRMKRKLVSGSLIFLVLCAFWQLVLAGYLKDMSIWDYFTVSAEGKADGGFFGGLQVYALCHVLGTVGAWVIILAELVLLVMYFTEKFLFSYLRQKGKNFFDFAREKIGEIRNSVDQEEWIEEEPVREVSQSERAYAEKPVHERKQAPVYETGFERIRRDYSPKKRQMQHFVLEKEEKTEEKPQAVKAKDVVLEKIEKNTEAEKKDVPVPQEASAPLKGVPEADVRKTDRQDFSIPISRGGESGKKKEEKKAEASEERTIDLEKLPVYEKELNRKFHSDEILEKEIREAEEPEKNRVPDSLDIDIDDLIEANRKKKMGISNGSGQKKDPETGMVLFEERQEPSHFSEYEPKETVMENPVKIPEPVPLKEGERQTDNGEHDPALAEDLTGRMSKDMVKPQAMEQTGFRLEQAEKPEQSEPDGAEMETLSEERLPFDLPEGEEASQREGTGYIPEELTGKAGKTTGTASEEGRERVPENMAAGKMDESERASDDRYVPPVEPDQLERPETLEEQEKQEEKVVEKPKHEHVFPSIDLLNPPVNREMGDSEEELQNTARCLQMTLDSFKVAATVKNASCGPQVTRFEVQPEPGVKVSKITGLIDDIKLNLAAADIRMEAPIPGKAAVGIEVPNKVVATVTFRELIDTDTFRSASSNVTFAVGKDISGKTIVTDIAKMPHLLIAGSTGSGKSVCINTLIMSILYKASPEDVKLIMVDPKVVELSVYNGIPHLLIPVVTDPNKALGALNWAVAEMEDRYSKFKDLAVRDLKGYNEKIKTVEEYKDERYQKLPQMVIILDELADLMMVTKGEVETPIVRLSQKARAAGIHLIIATQRPSVDVITGLIKANVPSRIAFLVSSQIDSRTILDTPGAEHLIGKGDMLFAPAGFLKPKRVQGAFVSDEEVNRVVEFLTSQYDGSGYDEALADQITSVKSETTKEEASKPAEDDGNDEYFKEAARLIVKKKKASIGLLQRAFRIGYNRAARLMEQLCDAGIVGEEQGTKPRELLVDEYSVERILEGDSSGEQSHNE